MTLRILWMVARQLPRKVSSCFPGTSVSDLSSIYRDRLYKLLKETKEAEEMIEYIYKYDIFFYFFFIFERSISSYWTIINQAAHNSNCLIYVYYYFFLFFIYYMQIFLRERLLHFCHFKTIEMGHTLNFIIYLLYKNIARLYKITRILNPR